MGDPVPGGGRGPGFPGLTCDSPACQSALGMVAIDRNRVLSKCAQVEATKGRRDALAAIAAALLVAAVALLIGAGAATATVWGILLAAALLIAAIAAFALFSLFASFALAAAVQYAIQVGELNAERARFTDDAANVTRSCPSTCWGDLTLPSCPD